jgi:hypothetical protein
MMSLPGNSQQETDKAPTDDIRRLSDNTLRSLDLQPTAREMTIAFDPSDLDAELTDILGDHHAIHIP